MAYWLDDGFDTWPEVVRVGTAAAGLYVRCGSWIARTLSDGHVPGEVATMYGSAEWIRKLLDVGLWETEENGYRDVRYFTMGNPPAEKVRARKVAKAERQRRWLEKTRERRGSRPPKDASRDLPADLPPALPPSKEGTGHAPARARGAAHAPDDQDPGPTWLDDPVQLAAHRAEIARIAEESTLALAHQRETAHNGAALARQVLAAKPPPKARRARRDAMAELRALTDLPPPAADPPEGATA
jgi:hypothetical protein